MFVPPLGETVTFVAPLNNIWKQDSIYKNKERLKLQSFILITEKNATWTSTRILESNYSGLFLWKIFNYNIKIYLMKSQEKDKKQ